MKTDSALRQDVLAELAWEPGVDATHLQVGVADGVVTLAGHVPSHAQRHVAIQAVRRVAGVRALAVGMLVQLAAGLRRGDAEIRAAAEHALAWSVMLPPHSVQPTVDCGRLTLDGQVDWAYQRDVAERAVRELPGVMAVHDRIQVRQTVRAGAVRQQIHDALARQADHDARHVEVLVDGSFVTLRGQVRSWSELEAVSGAAWSSPGVMAVNNELTVQV